MEIHHIGYLVQHIEKSISAFEALGYAPCANRGGHEIYYDESRSAEICFLRNGTCCVELIAPREDSAIYPLLRQYRNAPYHICYRCVDMDAAIQELRKRGFRCFTEKQAALAIGESAVVAFMVHAAAGIIELLQE